MRTIEYDALFETYTVVMESGAVVLLGTDDYDEALEVMDTLLETDYEV